MSYPYNFGFITALNDMGLVKTADPALAAQMASGADPQELMAVSEAKITENDIASAAKVIQVMAEMKQQADAQMPEQQQPGAEPAPMQGN